MEIQPTESFLPDFEIIDHPRTASLSAIRSTAWGAGLPEPMLTLILDYVRPCRVSEGTLICKEGERGDFMAFVISGRLRVFRKDYFHEERQLTQLGPGNSFGEMALVDNEPRSASIQTVEDCELLVLSVEDFRQMLTDKPDAAIELLFQVSRVLSQRVRYLNRRVLEHLL